MAARIHVFLSAPTALTDMQQLSYGFITDVLTRENLETRALGRSDFGTDFPLREVFSIARHCSGGVILGYSQMRAKELNVKPGTRSHSTESDVPLPTPWNNLEAGILFALKLPLMVFREDGINGGIFDNGVSDVFIQHLPLGVPSGDAADAIEIAIKNWVGKVCEHYRVY